MPWLEDLISVLEEENVGVYNTNIFASSRSVQPRIPSGDASLVVIETPGPGSIGTHNSLERPASLQPAAQITGRAKDYAPARAMAQLAYDALYLVRNRYVNSGWYLWMRPQQEPADLGTDPQGFVRVGFNVVGRIGSRPR